MRTPTPPGAAAKAVSSSLERSRARWAQFNAWGVDGICTDYPVELRDYLDGVTQGVRA